MADHGTIMTAAGGGEAQSPARASAGNLLTARIDSLDYEGRGVARVEGKVVFIEGALPGETVRFTLKRRRRRFDTARLVEVVSASPERVAAPCPHFGVCGGCSLQHMKPEAQIAAKQQVLADQLTRIGKVEPQQWLAPLHGDTHGYRRRARLGVRYVEKKGGVLVGFRERASTYITPLTQCLILTPVVSALLPALRDLIAGLSCAQRLPQVEVAGGDDQTALVFRHLEDLTDTDREALRAFGERHGVQIWLQGGGPESVQPLWPAQPARLGYALTEFDVRFEYGPSDFVQVNAAMNARMVKQALQLLELGQKDRVLDLFCGLGNFTLPIARRAGGVLGIEADARAVALAQENAARNGCANAQFRVANLYDESAGEPVWADFAFNKLLLDPPRSGAIEAIKRLAEPLPERIVYVSCYPATLARDSDYLVHALGYRLVAAGVMDMFPHTSHVESMALFQR